MSVRVEIDGRAFEQMLPKLCSFVTHTPTTPAVEKAEAPEPISSISALRQPTPSTTEGEPAPVESAAPTPVPDVTPNAVPVESTPAPMKPADVEPTKPADAEPAASDSDGLVSEDTSDSDGLEGVVSSSDED